MIQLNRIQLTSQTPNQVEMTKILRISQRESRIMNASVCLEYASSETNKSHSYKIRFSLRL